MSGNQERGLTVRDNRTISDPREEEQLTRQLILKNATEPQLRLVMGICNRYGFDPLLKHVVIVSNNIYVTRDGLLHLAHASGQFNGIGVEMAQTKNGEWMATCTVHRKDMDHPIVYTAFESEHKPANPGGSAWGKYPRAMLQKCAEVMALRRAFDVSVGAAEEIGYDGITPQTSAGRVTVIEAAPREPQPDTLTQEIIDADVTLTTRGPRVLDAETFAEVQHAIAAMAHHGSADSAIKDYMRPFWKRGSADQRATIEKLWNAISDARKAGLPWPDPDEPSAEEIGAADAGGNTIEVDPFSEGQPASIAG